MFFLHAFLPLRLDCVRCEGAPTMDFVFFFCFTPEGTEAVEVEAFWEPEESAMIDVQASRHSVNLEVECIQVFVNAQSNSRDKQVQIRAILTGNPPFGRS